jgi:hypothetical protein
MAARPSGDEAVADAMEMAVLSTVHHPHIVQLYACLPGMVLADDGGRPSVSLPTKQHRCCLICTDHVSACMHAPVGSALRNFLVVVVVRVCV